MKVGEIVDRDTAIDTIGDENVWDGELFALPDASEVPHFIHTVDAHHIAPLLRFGSDGSSAFNLPDGRLSPNDLQMMREVSPESSSHLYELWENSYPFPEESDELDDDNEAWNEGEGIDADREMMMDMQRLEAEKMIAECEGALRDNPNDAMALYNMGVAYAMLGEPERERECYNRVLLLEPENEAARFNLGCSFAGQGELEAAANEFQILVDGGTEMPPAHFMLGSMLAQLGREEEGIRALRRGLQYDPEDGQAYFNIGRALMPLGRFSEAVIEFQSARRHGFNDVALFMLLAECHRELGDKASELEAYRSGLDSGEFAFELMLSAGIAWAHLHGGEEGRAIPYLEFTGPFILIEDSNQFHLGLGMIATGVIEEAKAIVEELGGPTTELGSKLTRMIRIAESL
jgi:tetratricopeptide (TPR) repeat protein